MLCIPEQFRVFETSEPKNMEALGNAWAFSVWRGTYQRHICLDSVKAARTISTILIYIYMQVEAAQLQGPSSCELPT